MLPNLRLGEHVAHRHAIILRVSDITMLQCMHSRSFTPNPVWLRDLRLGNVVSHMDSMPMSLLHSHGPNVIMCDPTERVHKRACQPVLKRVHAGRVSHGDIHDIVHRITRC